MLDEAVEGEGGETEGSSGDASEVEVVVESGEEGLDVRNRGGEVARGRLDVVNLGNRIEEWKGLRRFPVEVGVSFSTLTAMTQGGRMDRQ